MLSMNPGGGRGNTRSSRAISIADARMAAAIAMHPLACGPVCVHRTGRQPGKNGTQRLNREKIF